MKDQDLKRRRRRNNRLQRTRRGTGAHTSAPFDGTLEVFGDGAEAVTWSNATAGRSVVCADGVLRFAEASEATFSGYRRVEALVEGTDDNFDIGTWDLLGGSRSGQQYTFNGTSAIYMNNIGGLLAGQDIRVTIRFRYISGSEHPVAIYQWNDGGTHADTGGDIPFADYGDGEWHEYTTLIQGIDATVNNWRFGLQGRVVGMTTVVEIDYIMIEDVSGYSDQGPSEVLRSTVDYKVSGGAAVTGVAYRKAKPSCTLTQVGSTATYEVTNRDPLKTVMDYPENKLWGIDFTIGTTNVVTTPRQWDGVWTASGLTTTTTTTGIDGRRDLGDAMVEDTSTGTHSVREAQTVTATDDAMTISAYVKRVAGTHNVALAIGDSGLTSIGGAKLNMTTGVASEVTVAGSPTIHWVDVIDYGNGWFRLMACVDPNVVGTTANTIVYITDDTETLSYTGDGSSSVCFDCVQLEEKGIATPYIEGTRANHGNVRAGLDIFGPAQTLQLLREFCMRYKVTYPYTDGGNGFSSDGYRISQVPFGWDSNEPVLMGNGGSSENIWQLFISGNLSSNGADRPTVTEMGGTQQPLEIRARFSDRENKKNISVLGGFRTHSEYSSSNPDLPTSTESKIGFAYGTDTWYCLKDAEFIKDDSKNDEWLKNTDSQDR